MAEIDRLTVVWDARFDKFEEKLNKVVRSTYGSAAKIEKRLDAANTNINRSFAQARIATLQELAPGADRYATALSALGESAIAAGFALAGLIGAVNQANAAMDFGDEVQATADKLQISAEALQELRFAAEETDVPLEVLDESLKKLNGTIGAFKTGIGAKRVSSAFEALGITKESLKDVTNATELLPLLADRLGQVSDTAAQVQIAKKLGIEGLLPLLRQGSDGLAEMREQARELGLVIDNQMIKALADADRQMEIATRQIDASLKVAFSGLAVEIAHVVNALAQFLVSLRQSQAGWAVFARSVSRGLDPVNLLPNGRALRAARDQARRQQGGRQLVADIRDALSKPLATSDAGFDLDLAGSDKGGSKAKKARDTTLQRTQEIDRAFRDVERDLLNAWQSLLVEAENRAEVQRQLLDLEIAGRNAEFDRQKADILADEGLTAAKKEELAAQIERLREQAKGVDDLRREAIDRDLSAQKATESLSLRQSEIQAQEEALSVQADLARTAAEERTLRLQLLDLADQRVRLEQEAVLASQAATEAQKQEARRRIEQLEASRGAREAGVIRSTQSPLESYFDSLPQTAQEANERFEALAANGIADVVDGLAQALAGTRSLGDVFRQVIAQMAVDLTRLNLQRALMSFLPGLGGGSAGVSPSVNGVFGFASGGYTGDGSRNKIAGVVHGQEFVVNAAATKRNLALLQAINAGAMPRQSPGPVSQSFSPTINVTVSGGSMSPADARRTGSMIASEAMAHMALARRKGFA